MNIREYNNANKRVNKIMNLISELNSQLEALDCDLDGLNFELFKMVQNNHDIKYSSKALNASKDVLDQVNWIEIDKSVKKFLYFFEDVKPLLEKVEVDKIRPYTAAEEEDLLNMNIDDRYLDSELELWDY